MSTAEKPLQVHHCLLMLNNIQTHILSCGSPFDCNGQDVIICIPGNPGIADFYREFAVKLHRFTNLPLCIVGHAGHEVVPHEQSNVLKNQEHLFDLGGQIKHKVDFINKCIDSRSKLHFIGHSIGAWFILEILQDHESILNRVASVNLLFPTLQKLGDTRNGKFITYFVQAIHSLVLFLFFLAYLLPDPVVFFLVKLYLNFNSYPMYNFIGVNKLLNVEVGEKMLHLAYDEMSNVKNLNVGVIDKIKHKTNVIYSSRDNWAPLSYMEDLKQFEPEIKMKEVDIDHAFVLKSSETVADMVAQFINPKSPDPYEKQE